MLNIYVCIPFAISFKSIFLEIYSYEAVYRPNNIVYIFHLLPLNTKGQLYMYAHVICFLKVLICCCYLCNMY